MKHFIAFQQTCLPIFLILKNFSDFKSSVYFGAKKYYHHPAKSLQDKIIFSFQL